MPVENSQLDTSIAGTYRHSKKGTLYKVLGMARHSETLEKFVVYQATYNSEEFGERPIWIRPYDMFFETVMIDGKEVPRFERVSD